MSLRRLLIASILSAPVVLPTAASAANWDAAFAQALPPEEVAKGAVDAYPDVSRAKAELELALAEARGLDAGPYEFVVNANSADNYPKFTWDIARTIRLPGKARLDHKAGKLGVEAAKDLVDDARHQTGLILSDAWYAWVETEIHLSLDRDTEAAAKRDLEAVRKRVDAKDAAQLDLELAEAALATAVSHRALSEGKAETARLALVRGFPELPMPVRPPVLPPPPLLEHPVSEWAEITVKSSHEIAIADFQAQKADVLAQRARADRFADPTIGIRAVPEFAPGGYKINGVGVYVSTPIGGARRRAVADSEAARASVARVNLMRIKRESAALGERNAITSESTRLSWQATATAVDAAKAAAARTLRGYQLGELDLQAVLIANRQVVDAEHVEITARADAWRAVTHLRLDSHDMWHDAEPEEEGTKTPAR